MGRHDGLIRPPPTPDVEPVVVHLAVDFGEGEVSRRVWCGRERPGLKHVHSGDPDAIPELVPGARVCAVCKASRARGLR